MKQVTRSKFFAVALVLCSMLINAVPTFGQNKDYFDDNGAYFGPTRESQNYSGAYYTGDYPNLLKKYLGKTDKEIEEKLDEMWENLFHAGINKRIFFDIGSSGYIIDKYNNDVRSYEMGYAMMICVQIGNKSIFDKLWAFLKNHMWNKSGFNDGYFSCLALSDGSVRDTNIDPIAELYITTALLFASNRWNVDSYKTDAQYILERMWTEKTSTLFNASENLVTFPHDRSVTTPAYSMPAFFELYSRWSDYHQEDFLAAINASRNFLYNASNSESGLFTSVMTYGGEPYSISWYDSSTKYDVPAKLAAMNIGMDYYLFGKDVTREAEVAKRIIDFLESNDYTYNYYNWSGTSGSGEYSVSNKACHALLCLALTNTEGYEDIIRKNLQMAWDASVPSSTYYDTEEALLDYLAMLMLSGNFKIWKDRDNVCPDIAIGETKFPDANFRNFLKKQTYGYDGFLTSEELATVYKMEVDDKGIEDLKGIEHFEALRYLDCCNNSLTKLNLLFNTNLVFVYADGNQISGDNMTDLMRSLPSVKAEDNAQISIINTKNPNEKNVCNTMQVKLATDKGWSVLDWNNNNPVAYKGSEYVVTDIAPWENWCKTAVTFSFDKAATEVVSHQWAVSKLNGYNFKATFNMQTNTASDAWNTYKGFAENGHEIGSLTDSYSTAESQLSSSKQTITNNIGQPCLTISYPNGQHMGSTVLDYYIAGRTCTGTINPRSPSDMSRIDGIICGSQGLNSSPQMATKCTYSDGGWVVFIINGIQGYAANGSYSPMSQEAFTGVLNMLDEHRDTYWVGTMRDVAMYIKERDNAEFKRVSKDDETIVYSLLLDVDRSVCNWDYPLSLRINLPEGWEEFTIKQGETDIEPQIKDGMVYFKAIPGAGDIVFKKAKDETGINNVNVHPNARKEKNTWYGVDGRRLNGKPSGKGVYIKGGEKVLMK